MYACIGISTLITPFTLSCISPYPPFFFFFPCQEPTNTGAASHYLPETNGSVVCDVVQVHVAPFFFFYKPVRWEPVLRALHEKVGRYILVFFWSFFCFSNLVLTLNACICYAYLPKLYEMKFGFCLWFFVTIIYACPTQLYETQWNLVHEFLRLLLVHMRHNG